MCGQGNSADRIGGQSISKFSRDKNSTPDTMKIPPLVNPLAAENAAVVQARLAPNEFYNSEEMGEQCYQAPPGSLAWTILPAAGSSMGPEGKEKEISAVCYATKPMITKFSSSPNKLVVLGTVASPVADPDLLARHPDELAHLAVFVSGSHTILAHPDDCQGLNPMDFIKVDTGLDTGLDNNFGVFESGEYSFAVPRVSKAGSAFDDGSFAMVLQVGMSELRILLTQERFNQG